MPTAPLRYAPSVETPEPDEAETTRQLVEALHSISETTFRDYGHAVRSVHAKSHGLLHGQLEIAAGLPEALAQGIFARPGKHPVTMRFSTTPGDLLDDDVSTPRGVAIKIADATGRRLPGSEGQTTQDFIMVNGPSFSSPTAKAFVKNLKRLAATTDKAEGLKKLLSAALRNAEAVIETAGLKSATLTSLGGHPRTHILGETFFTQVPVRYGDYIAKLSMVPVSPELLALKGKTVEDKDSENFLREAVTAFFAGHEAAWELRVQLRTDEASMPIEDSSVVWPEAESPYLTVGRVTAKNQPAWSETLSREIDDGMAFSPWQGIEEHRPLGSIMRVRKATYEMSSSFRGSHNGCPIHR